MSYDNSILCNNCNGRNFEPANGAFYCHSCGTESRAHGQDFVNEETSPPFIDFDQDSDSNDESHWTNDYPDKNLSESDNDEESTYEEESLTFENLGKSHFTSDSKHQKFDLETDNESQEEQAGS